MSQTDRFKQCPGCGTWFSRGDFLANPELEPVGMQFEDGDFNFNMYYFTHDCPRCGSTFTVRVQDFLPFIEEEIPPEILAGSESCEQRCLKMEDLEICSQECAYAPFRRFLVAVLRARRSGDARPDALVKLTPP